MEDDGRLDEPSSNYRSFRTQPGGKAVRRTTGASFGLDIASLTRYLDGPTRQMTWGWKRGNLAAGNIGLLVTRESIALMYTISRDGCEPETVHEDIAVTRTGCNYGGARVWFVCPGCMTRRRVLYLPSGAMRFRCRECHRLTYSTQQMDTHDRHLHRIHTLQKKLDGGEGEYSPFRIPPKTKGMRLATYYQIHDQILMHEIERNKILASRFAVLSARFEKRRPG